MKKRNVINTLSIAAGAALTLGAAGTAQADTGQNPFQLTELSSGYRIADAGEAKCGEAKCGSNAKQEAEAKCGAEKAAESKCGANAEAEDEKIREAKCGEAKCGASR